MERPAFDRLLTATIPRIERCAQAYAARYNLRHEWQDIAQTALLKMLRFADYYDPGKGEFMPWACVVIINTIKSRIAQIATAPGMNDINALIIERTQTLQNPESDLQAVFILDNLNEEARLYVEGYNYEEIASRQGFKSKVTAHNRVRKCAENLRNILNGTTPAKARKGRPPKKNHLRLNELFPLLSVIHTVSHQTSSSATSSKADIGRECAHPVRGDMGALFCYPILKNRGE